MPNAIAEAAKAFAAEHGSDLEYSLEVQLRQRQLPAPVRQYAFASAHGRKFRADFAWPEHGVIVEVEGGTWGHIRRRDGSESRGGRHNTPEGFERDCDRSNLAALLRFRVFRFTAKMVESGKAAELLEMVLRDETGRL